MSSSKFSIYVSDEKRNDSDTSFSGGVPKIPPSLGLPKCHLCGADESFFFQLAFPKNHPYEGNSIAVFECTECAHPENFIPEMLHGELLGADIPIGFLDSYQVNFSIVVFETSEGRQRHDYGKPKIKFKSWNFSNSDDNVAEALGFIGGKPVWVLENETPATYGGTERMNFLFQLNEGIKFETEKDAPQQVTLGIDGKPKRSKGGSYSLFLGNQLYFFGTADEAAGNRKIYIITQRS